MPGFGYGYGFAKRRRRALAAAYSFPALTTAKYDGDSRTASIGGRAASSTLTVDGGYGAGPNGAGMLQAVCGNKWLLGEGFLHAIGGSTTKAMLERAHTTSIATTGNAAQALTTISSNSDAKFSTLSDSVATVMTQAGGHVFSPSVSVNDNTGGSSVYYTNPGVSMDVIGQYADELGAAGKCWYLGNEFPQGRSAYLMVARTISGQTCTATNTTTYFVDGESYGAAGVIGVFASGHPRYCAKVASSPGQDEYTVAYSANVATYTFGGTAPVTAYLTYTGSGTSGGNTSSYLRTMHEWFASSAANFVSSTGTDFGRPGFQYNRPHCRVFDTWNALLDTTTGALLQSKPGTLDPLQLHQNIFSAYKAAVACKAKFDADYPTALSLEQRPIRNNWYAARGINSGTTYSGTLPPSMRTAATGGAPAPTLISMNGVPIGKVDTSTGAITGTGIASGTLTFSTGAWSITFTSAAQAPLNGQIWFEQDIGNYDLTTMTEGTIGRNALMNGMLDATAASGSNLSATTGTTTIAGLSVPYGWALSNAAFATAVTNGTASVTTSSVTTGDGYPRWTCEIEGSHTAATALQIVNTMASASARFTAGDKMVAGARVAYDKHSTLAHFFGTQGSTVSLPIQHASYSVAGNSGPTSITFTTTRILDGGTGLYLDDTLLNEAGGGIDLYRLSPQVDTTGRSATNVNFALIIANTQPNVPFAGKFGFGQVQARRRNDV